MFASMQPAGPGQTVAPTISPVDPKTRKHKTETTARQTSAPPPEWLRPPPSHLMDESPEIMQLRLERDVFAPSSNGLRNPSPHALAAARPSP